MANDTLSSYSALTPGRRALWLVLLVGASVAFTLAFACAVPFAAFAAVSAATLSRRDGLLLAVALWLANQAVGFAVLGYPGDTGTLAWGVALGAVAMLTTAVAYETSARLTRAGTRAVVTFLAAFAVYEGTLALLSLTPLGGTEDFAPAIVAYVFALNAVAAVGLYALHRLAVAAGFMPPARLAVAR